MMDLFEMALDRVRGLVVIVLLVLAALSALAGLWLATHYMEQRYPIYHQECEP